jgi:hypothetical protein
LCCGLVRIIVRRIAGDLGHRYTYCSFGNIVYHRATKSPTLYRHKADV